MKDNKNKIYIAVGLAVILLVFFFLGKSYGRNKPPDPVTPPEDLQTDGTTTAATGYDPTELTNKFWEGTQGASFTHAVLKAAIAEALNLSNTNLVKVANDWNKRYFSKNTETLPQAINNEWWIDPADSAPAYTLIYKFNNLGIK